MIGWHDPSPDVEVAQAEYQRLLGYPPGRVLEGRARELAEWARSWYARYGRPWTCAREVTLEELAPFHAGRLREMLRATDAHRAVLAAVSAGPEIEAESERIWREDRPDEYFFLEMYGSAVVEHLTMQAGARLCAWAEERGCSVLPHDSPGYPDWDIAEQPLLFRLLTDLPGPMEVLDSGMLRPKKSLLAVFGITRRTEGIRRLTEMSPCENCSFGPCQYRRASYRGAILSPDYGINRKALDRWSRERLSLTRREDGCTDALFRFEGTTCTNLGRPLAFDYAVTLGPAPEGYPIREQRCAPAAGDRGHTAMCEYIKNPDALMNAIEREKPLLGHLLGDVLSWKRPSCATGCYCDEPARWHKWGLVLETIHYALRARGGQ